METLDIAISYVMIALLVLIVLSVIFRKVLPGLIYDYLVDGGLSFLDNILGVGLLPIGDVGDYLAGFIIYNHEKKISGKFPALLAGWEATNFFPLGILPGVELVTNATPAVFLSRMAFQKFSKAQKDEKLLEKDVALANSMGIEISLDEVKKDLNSNPIEAISLEKDIRKKLKKVIRPKIESKINQLERTVSQRAVPPPGFKALIEAARAANRKSDFHLALEKIVQAQELVLQEFPQQYQLSV